MGWLNLFDPLGREGKPGTDYLAAQRYYQHAAKQSPDEKAYLSKLANLLLVNKDGVNFGKGAPLDAAIETINTLRDKFDDKSHDADLMRAYMWQEAFEKAAAFAATVDDPAKLDSLYVAALAMSSGTGAAVRKAEELANEDASRLLFSAASVLALMQKFDTA
jgi:hypothetical protein